MRFSGQCCLSVVSGAAEGEARVRRDAGASESVVRGRAGSSGRVETYLVTADQYSWLDNPSSSASRRATC